MSVGKATVPDGISVKMLKIASRYTTKSLTHIIIQYVNKMRALPEIPKKNTRWLHIFIKVEIHVIQLTIALFPYNQ